MDRDLFDWDPEDDQAGNTIKIARTIDPELYEYLVLEGDPVYIGAQEADGEVRHRAVGYEVYGEPWTFVYTFREPRLRPIAAWRTTKPKEINKLEAGRPRPPLPRGWTKPKRGAEADDEQGC